ncbi:DNA-binding domain-containing protein [Methylomonas koyamae]|nr:DNA-binding domain-containing protein [Methylomonas koyamae]
MSQTLRDTYPVVNRLVGAGFFDRLARAISPNIHRRRLV